MAALGAAANASPAAAEAEPLGEQLIVVSPRILRFMLSMLTGPRWLPACRYRAGLWASSFSVLGFSNAFLLKMVMNTTLTDKSGNPSQMWNSFGWVRTLAFRCL